MDDNSDKPTGYGNPPKATRFQPGKSGNPKGRPLGAKNFATAFAKELDTKVTVIENGKRKTITKRMAIAKQMTNKAVVGDPRATPIVLSEARRIEEEPSAAGGAITLLPEDAVVMADIVRRMRATAEPLETAATAAVTPTDPSAEPETKP